MTDPVPQDPAPPPPAYSGPAGIALMVVGQTVPRHPTLAYAGLAVGVVLGVMNQRGK